MLLINITLFARTNEMTINCPLYEDLELPPPDARQQWDSDGLPKYVILALRCAQGAHACLPSQPSPTPLTHLPLFAQEMENAQTI